jgi:hypothetical protein
MIGALETSASWDNVGYLGKLILSTLRQPHKLRLQHTSALELAPSSSSCVPDFLRTQCIRDPSSALPPNCLYIHGRHISRHAEHAGSLGRNLKHSFRGPDGAATARVFRLSIFTTPNAARIYRILFSPQTGLIPIHILSSWISPVKIATPDNTFPWRCDATHNRNQDGIQSLHPP